MASKISPNSGVVKILVGGMLLFMYGVSLSAQETRAALPDAPTPNLIAFDAGPDQQSPQKPTPSTPVPTPAQSSSDNGSQLSLGDLGLTTEQTQGSAQDQARLDKRTHMLKVHQRLGLLTAIPLAATLFASAGASCPKQTVCSNTAGADFHASLGAVTVGMYAATAYYAIAAPRIPGTTKKGAIRWHEALVWVHATGMVLTPILGAMALDQQNNGQRVHGIASAHGAVAATTAIAYVTSIIAVSWPIKIKFWEHQ